MDLGQLLSAAGGDAIAKQMANQLGISSGDAQRGIEQLLPALSRGMGRNAGGGGGLDSLVGALAGGNHDRYLDPDVLGRPDSIADGNAILGHILGSKDASRNVAAQASQQSGLDSSILKQMLPMLATVAMGALAKNMNTGGASRAGAAPGATGGSPLDFLSQVLDTDGDGSAIDDVLNLAKKFF